MRTNILVYSLLLLFAFLWASPGYAQKGTSDTISRTVKPGSPDSNLDKEYIAYLKEMNKQTQEKDEKVAAFYDYGLNWLSVLVAVVMAFFLVLGIFGLSELKKIRKERSRIEAQREQIEKDRDAIDLIHSGVQKEFENFKKTTEQNSTEFRDIVRDNVANHTHHSILDVYVNLHQYELANLVSNKINDEEEDDEFKRTLKFNRGKIAFFLRNYTEAERVFIELLSSDKDKFYVCDFLGATYHRKHGIQTLGLDEREQSAAKSIELFNEALQLAQNDYDKKRTLSNIAVSYNMLGKDDKVIETFNQARKIELRSEPFTEMSLQRLEAGVYVPAIFVYWRNRNPLSYELVDELLRITNVESIAKAKTYLISELKIDPEKLEQFLLDYETYKKDRND